MTYNTNASRVDDGRYRMEYGKGSKKLVDECVRDAEGKWSVQSVHFTGRSFSLLRDAKEAWHTWATTAYGSGADLPEVTPPGSPDTIPEAPLAAGDFRIIDGIRHQYKPSGAVLDGPWCWIGDDGLNLCERRTNAAAALQPADPPVIRKPQVQKELDHDLAKSSVVSHEEANDPPRVSDGSSGPEIVADEDYGYDHRPGV